MVDSRASEGRGMKVDGKHCTETKVPPRGEIRGRRSECVKCTHGEMNAIAGICCGVTVYW